MDTIPSEMLRGHVDTIILLSLLDCDKHTFQIKDEIESKVDGQFELKQGTFYSCLQRIVAQGYVTEYRSTSIDGKRRKFFHLTEKGKTYIEANKDKWLFSRSIIDTLISVKPDETPIEIHTNINNTAETAQNNQQIKPKTQKYSPYSLDLDEFDDETDEYEATTDHNDSISDEKIATVDSADESTTIISKDDASSGENVQQDLFVDVDKETPSDVISVKTAESKDYFEKKYIFEERDIIEEKIDNDVTEITVEQPKQVDLFAETQPITEEICETDREPEEPKPIETATNDSETVYSVDLIDTAALPTSDNVVPSEESATEQVLYIPPIQAAQNEEDDDFFANEAKVSRDYKDVLTKLFATTKKTCPTVSYNDRQAIESATLETAATVDDSLDDIKEEMFVSSPVPPRAAEVKPQKKPKKLKAQEITEETIPQKSCYDFSEIFQMAKDEGFKVKASFGTNKGELGKILINKLVAASSLTFYLIFLAEIFVLAITTAQIAQIKYLYFGIFAAVCALFPIISIIVYFVKPKRKIDNLISFKTIIEFTLVIVLNLILLIFVYAIFAEINFADVKELLIYILYPLLFIINIPIYFFIKYLKLEKQCYFS